jgi:hypothetical protein
MLQFLKLLPLRVFVLFFTFLSVFIFDFIDSIEASEQGARFEFLFLFFIFFCVFIFDFIDSIEASEQGARVECLKSPGQCPCLQLREFFLKKNTIY